MTVDASPLLHLVRTGPSDGEAVLLIHPVGLDGTFWDAQIEFLRSTHRVVACDLAGHGGSAPPSDGRMDWARTVREVIAVLDAADVERAHVVGISLGGMVAQLLALDHPGRVASLVLIATASGFPEPARAAMRDRARRVREHGMGAVVDETLARWFTRDTRRNRPDLIDRVTRTLRLQEPDVHAALWDAISTFDTTARLSAVTCPTLILVGDADPSTPPAAAQIMREAIAGSRLVVLPSVSHMATLERPDSVNAEIGRFFADIAAPAKAGAPPMPVAERLARNFFRRVWAAPHDLDAIDELMTEDYRITTAGTVVEGRAAFKAWVGAMQRVVQDATNEHVALFTSPAGDMVVSRWITRGIDNGMFGLPATGKPVEFSGIAIWRVEGDRLAECWVERSAHELYQRLTRDRS